MSYFEIVWRIGVLEFIVRFRVKRFVEKGVIWKFVVFINLFKVGYLIVVFIVVDVELGKVKEVVERLSKFLEVDVFGIVMGVYDILM